MLTFNGSSSLALALGGGLFVKLTGAPVGQKTGLFDSTLEAADGHFERLVFLDTNVRHINHPLPLGACQVKYSAVRAKFVSAVVRKAEQYIAKNLFHSSDKMHADVDPGY